MAGLGFCSDAGKETVPGCSGSEHDILGFIGGGTSVFNTGVIGSGPLPGLLQYRHAESSRCCSYAFAVLEFRAGCFPHLLPCLPFTCLSVHPSTRPPIVAALQRFSRFEARTAVRLCAGHGQAVGAPLRAVRGAVGRRGPALPISPRLWPCSDSTEAMESAWCYSRWPRGPARGRG